MSVYTYGAVLALSLGAAWYQWSKPPSITKGEEVVILYGEKTTTIEGISWESEKDKVVLELRSDEHGPYMWGTYTDKKKEDNPVKSFKVGKDGNKLLTSFSPLVAIRSLRDLTDEKKEGVQYTRWDRFHFKLNPFPNRFSRNLFVADRLNS